MSGIAGIYYLDSRPLDPRFLERMVGVLGHRGPNGSGMWHQGSTGLGHLMLWTTPESLKERLPFVKQGGDLVITADARIDNRDELLRILDFDGVTHSEVADSEIILAAYEKWGEQCPEKLLGDFAFAIWEGRAHRLFCARDPMGHKPLYYYQSDEIFAFASEIKALFCVPEVPRKVNELRIACHLARILDDATITFYDGIFRFPSAHCMSISDRQAQPRRYWSFDLTRRLSLRSNAEYAEALREIFTESVRCRMRSAFPVGSTLSGGLDSSSVACMSRLLAAGQSHHRTLHTFSAVFPDLPEKDRAVIDERQYIYAVLAMGGFEPHFIQADQLSPLIDFDRMLWHQDEAFISPNLYLHWGIYGAAQQAGVRVLLDGVDGDTTISHGWEHLPELVRGGSLITLFQEVTAYVKNTGLPLSRRKMIWELGFKPLISPSVMKVWKKLRGEESTASGFNPLISPAFARHIALEEHIRRLAEKGPARTAREKHLRGLTSPLYAYLLEVADKAAAAFSIEVRYPFFDRRLMEFCLALPSGQKFQRGWTRAILRYAMEGVLPREVQWRANKGDLSPNFKRGLLERERETLDKAILMEPQWIEDYVEMPAVHEAYRRYLTQPMSGEEDILNIYGAVMLHRWLCRLDFDFVKYQTKTL